MFVWYSTVSFKIGEMEFKFKLWRRSPSNFEVSLARFVSSYSEIEVGFSTDCRIVILFSLCFWEVDLFDPYTSELPGSKYCANSINHSRVNYKMSRYQGVKRSGLTRFNRTKAWTVSPKTFISDMIAFFINTNRTPWFFGFSIIPCTRVTKFITKYKWKYTSCSRCSASRGITWFYNISIELIMMHVIKK